MKTAIISSIIATAAIFCSCSRITEKYSGMISLNAEKIEASDNVVTKTEKLTNFEKMQFDVVADITVKQSTDNLSEMKISGPDNIVALFSQEVKNGVLYINMDKGYKWDSKKAKITIEVASPTITAITNDGVGDVAISKIQSPSLSIESNGVGNISISGAETGELSIDNDGVGSINASDITARTTKISNDGVGSIGISGKSGTTNIKNSGVGDIEAAGFVSETLIVRNSGVGDIDANATKTAEYHKGGVGSVNISGNAKVTKK